MQGNRCQRVKGGRCSLSHCLPSSARPLHSLSFPLACVVFTLADRAASAVQTPQRHAHSPALQGLHAHPICTRLHSWSSQLWLGDEALARSVGRQEVVGVPTTLLRQGRCVDPAQCLSPVTSGLGTNAKLTPFPVTPGSCPMLLWLFSGHIDSGGKRSISVSEPIGEQSTPTLSLCCDPSLQA